MLKGMKNTIKLPIDSQKRITVDNMDYYIDLLFYHRKMRRLVVIKLRLEEFKPEHKLVEA
jgi:predicted nuclease of restriction endonuclease-like (RecB) superfamily